MKKELSYKFSRYDENAYKNRAFLCYMVMARHQKIKNIFNNYTKNTFRILDVGCSKGEYLKDIDAVGIDLDRSALKRQIYGFQALLGDAQNLSIASGKIDIVLLSEVLEHLPDSDSAIDEVTRVLAEDGTLVISTPVKQSFYDRYYQGSILHILVHIVKKLLHRSFQPRDHISLQTPNDLKYNLYKRNLNITEEYYIGFSLPFTQEILNFLFRFNFVKKFYSQIDNNIDKTNKFPMLKWIMIFVCKKEPLKKRISQ